MCKINGHSIFSYMTQPWNSSKLFTSKQRAKETLAAQQKAAEVIESNSQGDEIAKTTAPAKINKTNKQTLSSLRVPLESENIGASVGSRTSLGLNLGG